MISKDHKRIFVTLPKNQLKTIERLANTFDMTKSELIAKVMLDVEPMLEQHARKAMKGQKKKKPGNAPTSRV